MKKARMDFEVKRQSDDSAVVRFPAGMKVGKFIDADALLIALLKHRPTLEVQGQCSTDTATCCGDTGGSCCKT